jgi:hypothetical protein
MLEKTKQILDSMYGKKIFFFIPLFIVVLIIIVFLWSLISGSSESSLMSGSSYSNAYPNSPLKSVSMNEYDTASPSDSLKSDRKVIKEANLDIVVKKIDESLVSIQTITSKYNGFVDSSDVSSGGSDTRYGTVTVRVPNESFNSVISDLKKIAVKVDSEVITSDDVTSRYVDLESRLKSKKAVESQYILLLKKAVKVEEIVMVHSYLDKVREEIEVMQGQMNYLSNQISMSSITISMTSESEVQIFGITWHPITTIKQSFRNLLSDLTKIVDFVIYFIFALPAILIEIALLVLFVWVVVRIIKILYRKFKKKKTSRK